jgi:hypothetical protein
MKEKLVIVNFGFYCIKAHIIYYNKQSLMSKVKLGEVTVCIFYETHEIKGFFSYAMK